MRSKSPSAAPAEKRRSKRRSTRRRCFRQHARPVDVRELDQRAIVEIDHTELRADIRVERATRSRSPRCSRASTDRPCWRSHRQLRAASDLSGDLARSRSLSPGGCSRDGRQLHAALSLRAVRIRSKPSRAKHSARSTPMPVDEPVTAPFDVACCW
jgi:hypothetical protein